MSILAKRILLHALPLAMAMIVAGPSPSRGQQQDKQARQSREAQAEKSAEKTQDPADPQKKATNDEAPPAPAAELPGPKPIPEVQIVPNLPTIPVRRDRPGYNYQMVNTALLPRDKEGIWVLDFAFKPLRIRTVEIPGKGRTPVEYLYYKVVNRTGKPRTFVPQFIMVNEEGKRFEDAVIPEVVPLVQAREDATIPVRGAVNIMGTLPTSTKEGVDDAVYGVAAWERWDAKSDRFSIYVRGLSDGYKEVPNPNGGKPIVKYKTLRIDFIRRGDEKNISEKEIELSDPAYEWVYW